MRLQLGCVVTTAPPYEHDVMRLVYVGRNLLHMLYSAVLVSLQHAAHQHSTRCQLAASLSGHCA
jgi:hypothetical protein